MGALNAIVITPGINRPEVAILDAARFIQALRARLETPALLFAE